MGAFEKHYSVHEIAELWNLSDETIRRHFRDEPGVVTLGLKYSHKKRSYVVLRIPESVAIRVHERLRNGGRR